MSRFQEGFGTKAVALFFKGNMLVLQGRTARIAPRNFDLELLHLRRVQHTREGVVEESPTAHEAVRLSRVSLLRANLIDDHPIGSNQRPWFLFRSDGRSKQAKVIRARFGKRDICLEAFLRTLHKDIRLRQILSVLPQSGKKIGISRHSDGDDNFVPGLEGMLLRRDELSPILKEVFCQQGQVEKLLLRDSFVQRFPFEIVGQVSVLEMLPRDKKIGVIDTASGSQVALHYSGKSGLA